MNDNLNNLSFLLSFQQGCLDDISSSSSSDEDDEISQPTPAKKQLPNPFAPLPSIVIPSFGYDSSADGSHQGEREDPSEFSSPASCYPSPPGGGWHSPPVIKHEMEVCISPGPAANELSMPEIDYSNQELDFGSLLYKFETRFPSTF